MKGVYPSTVQKLQRGLAISKSTQSKLGISSEAQTALHTRDLLETNSATALSKRLREGINSDVDMFDLASKLGVTESSLRKIYEGKPVTRALIKKVEEALRCSDHVDLSAAPSAAVERLRNIHHLYQQLGTLKAVGERMGLTRARIQQLLSKGSKIGLFEYNPREYPFITKEKLIDDCKKTLSLSRIARLNKFSTAYLQKLFTAYSITEEDLADYRLEVRRARCIEQFRSIAEDIGHHPNSTELQRNGKGRSLYNRITRYWRSIDNFRTQLNIPKPRHLRPHWLDSWHQIALVKRMQHLDTLRDCMSEFAPVGVSELCQKSNFGPNRIRRLLALMIATGEVKRIGQLASTKYRLTKTEVIQ
jgi:transcriptional regulator with XRE-family HTH domain